jgi:hypothetical protein
MRKLVAAALAGALFVAARGQASLVSLRPVTLAEVVSRSSTIVVAQRAKADPARPQKPSDSPFVVVEALRGPFKKGALLYVAPGYQSLHDQIGEQIAKHGYAGIPSPIEDSYKSSLTDAAFAKAKQVILLLACDEEKLHCELTVVNAYEAVKQRAAVEAAMHPTAAP